MTHPKKIIFPCICENQLVFTVLPDDEFQEQKCNLCSRRWQLNYADGSVAQSPLDSEMEIRLSDLCDVG